MSAVSSPPSHSSAFLSASSAPSPLAVFRARRDSVISRFRCCVSPRNLHAFDRPSVAEVKPSHRRRFLCSPSLRPLVQKQGDKVSKLRRREGEQKARGKRIRLTASGSTPSPFVRPTFRLSPSSSSSAQEKREVPGGSSSV